MTESESLVHITQNVSNKLQLNCFIKLKLIKHFCDKKMPLLFAQRRFWIDFELTIEIFFKIMVLYKMVTQK